MPSLRDQLQPTVNQAIALHQQGRVAEAEQIYRQVLQRDPANPDALHLLGLIAHHAGHPAPAIELMTRAIASAPDIALYHANLAKVYRGAGRLNDAIASARRATQLAPRFVEAYVELSACLRSARCTADAEKAARHALMLNPNHPDALSVLANVLSDQNQLDEAMRLYESALRARPDWPEALSNLGELLRKMGRFDDAERYLRQAISLAPTVAESHFNLAVILLARGDYQQGLAEYEWRWKQIGVHPRHFAQPLWSGSPLRGATILLSAEQGFGDTIQFVRYVPLVRDLGGRVIVECDASLARLIQSVDGVAEVAATGSPLTAFDVHCPLASLPHRFHTTVATIPSRIPYLSADPHRRALFREQLHLAPDELKIGIAWSGRGHPNPNRNCTLADFAPLAGISNIRWISLQLGSAREELRNPPPGMQIHDPADAIKDFADTAALMAELDLVISIDTAAAHLAGALARPAWTIHPYVTDWRWLLDRADSPWYPTMRIFRQSRRGDWSSVMSSVATELRKLSDAAHSPAHGPG